MSDTFTPEYDVIRPNDIDEEKKYRFGIVIMVHNRISLVRQCFESLRRTRLKDTIVLIVDDASTDTELLELIKEFSIADVPIVKIFIKRHRHFMIHANLRLSCDFLLKNYKSDYLVVLDSDTVQKPEWLEKLYEVYQLNKNKYEYFLVTGFNRCTNRARVLARHKGYCIKQFAGGANMFFDKKMYSNVVRDALVRYWDTVLCRTMQKKDYPILVLSPSVVQHKGNVGLFSTKRFYDFALDYSLEDSLKLFPIYLLQLVCKFHAGKQLVKYIARTKNMCLSRRKS